MVLGLLLPKPPSPPPRPNLTHWAMGINLSFTIYALISAITLSLTPSVDAAIYRIAHDNSQISYIPSVCDLDCTRVCRNQWWLSCLSNNSASHRTKGNNTSSNFSFQGSSVTWYTRTANDGGKAVVYIDGAQPTSVDTNSPVVNEANPVYTKSGLDPTKVHTISVVYDPAAFTEQIERFVDVCYFEYDDGGGSSGTTLAQNPVATPATTTTASGSAAANTLSPSPSSSPVSSTSSGTTSSELTARPSSLAPVLVTFSNGTIQTVAVSGNSARVPTSDTVSTGAIAGIVLGVAAVLCVFTVGCFFFGKRQQRRSAAMIKRLGKGLNSLPPDFNTQSRPVSHTNAGEPFNSTDTFFRNIRTSHFYTLRNPEGGSAQPILYSNASTSKRQLAQYSTPNLPELHKTAEGSPMQSFSPRPSHSHQPSEVSLESHIDARTDHVPASSDSATRMTFMSQDLSGGAHAYSMNQYAMDHRGDRSSEGTQLPSTPPPQYIR